jgi:hypothetical protein
MNEIVAFTRILLGDISTSNSSSPDIFTYGSSSVFSLSESNVISIVSVTINDVVTTNYTFSTTTGKLIVNATLVSGDIVEVIYTYYPNYSTTEIQNYVQSASVYLGTHHYEDFMVESTNEIYPEPTTKEQKLIALITATLIDPDNKSIRLPDLSINVPTDLPLDQKIGRIIAGYKHDDTGLFGIAGGIYD